MEQQHNNTPRPVNPMRRKRSRAQVFKESFLPVIIAGIALVLIIVFIVGAITRNSQKRKLEKEASVQASIAAENEEKRQALEADQLLMRAEELATGYDYTGATAILDSFTGDYTKFPQLDAARIRYQEAQAQLVVWEDPSQVVNLSFQLLIADPDRAFSNSEYGSSYNRNFITTGEFSKILTQLYENGYILVRLSDFLTTETDAFGVTAFTAKPLYLPYGKKPLVLTQTNVNYNTYMIDGDGDKLPDKDGAGFASRLTLDVDGNITCEMVDRAGNTVTGAYDLVPILDEFVAAHPDFSYRGAKAILALTGYDGLFGYRTNLSALETFSADEYNHEVEDATQMGIALRKDGYTLACYTYENLAYGERGVAEIRADLGSWGDEVVPLIGDLDILVFARGSDIAGEEESYSGEKFTVLAQSGFRYYLGFCEDGTRWATVENDYVRQGRLTVTGSTLTYHPEWFEGIFDVPSVLDSTRGTVPN